MTIDRMKVLEMWRSANFMNNERADQHNQMANLVMQYKGQFYDPVERVTGVPWYVVAAIDMREESFRHTRYIGNGQPLWMRTTLVPKGRGPFSSWFEGASDAFNLVGMSHLPSHWHWDIVTALVKCEGYNGFGYASHGLPSPYVWSGTNHQRAGRFTSDRHFEPKSWDTQPGCAGLFLALKEKHGVDLNEA